MSTTALDAFSAFGIELEYMLVDRHSLDVKPIADVVLAQAQKISPGEQASLPADLDWSNELALHVIELKNIRPGALAGLAEAFQTQIAQMNSRLSMHEACLMPTAMHPWMDPTRETRLWPHDEQAIYATFDRLFNCKRHAWANVQSMHINLPFADDKQFEKLVAAVRLVLPILPAIAASSPLADGAASGHMDTRMQVYRGQAPSLPTMVGSVVPEVVHSRSEQEACVMQPMYAEIEPIDPEHHLRHEWLNARGAIPRFDRNALEIRVMDMQECPQADVALAALVVDLVRLLYDEALSDTQTQQAIDTATLSTLLKACSRDAEKTPIAAAAYLAALGFRGGECTARDLWYHLSETLLSHDAAHLSLWQPHLQNVLQQGPLARRIVRALDGDTSPPALHAVYSQLTTCLRDAQPFCA